MEIEAKFSFRNEAAFGSWRGRSSLGSFALGPERTSRVTDTYVDGPQRPCFAGGYACRLRRVADRWVATLKSLSDAGPGDDPSVRRRHEHEVALTPPAKVDSTGANPESDLPAWQQPTAWPESEARSLALQLLHGEPLQRLTEITQERHERDVFDHERRVAVLSLDRVQFTNGRPEALELEVELTDAGRETDLERIVAVVRGDASFEPVTRSKLEAALAPSDGEERDAALGSDPLFGITVVAARPKSATEPLAPVQSAGESSAALLLFDATSGLHGLGNAERAVLAAAPALIASAEAVWPSNAIVTARDLLVDRPPPELDAGAKALLAGMLTALLSLREGNHWAKETQARLEALGDAPQLANLSPQQVEQAALLAAFHQLGDAVDAAQQDGRNAAAINVARRRITLWLSAGHVSQSAKAIQAAGGPIEALLRIGLVCKALEHDQSAPACLRFDQPLAQAGRSLLHVQRNAMAASEAGVRAHDEEAVHDMRVAVRRMRSLLRLLRRAYPRPAIKPLLRDLRRAGDLLGATRDLDVLLRETAAQAAELADRTGVDAVLDGWRARRDDARQQLLGFLDGEGYEELRRHLDEFLASGASTDKGRQRVCDAVPALIWRLFGAVQRYEPLVQAAAPAELHALRKAAKRLRYAIEFFRPLLGGATAALIDRTIAVQDSLGALHDSSVRLDLLSRQPDPQGPRSVTGVIALHDRALVEITEQRREFERFWPALHNGGFRRRLGKALAAL